MEKQFKEIRAKIDKALKKRIPKYLGCRFSVEYDYEFYFYIDIYKERSTLDFEANSIYKLKKEILNFLNNK